MTKPTQWPVLPAKTDQPGHSPSLIKSSLSAWRKGALATQWAHSKDSDQTGRMPRLFWVFAWRTGHFVSFVMWRLKLIVLLLLFRDISTAIFYCITLNGIALDMRDYNFWSVRAYDYIRPRILDRTRFNRAYRMADYSTRMYYVQEYMYRLRFNTKIAFADFGDLEDALVNALRISWAGKDHSGYKSWLWLL